MRALLIFSALAAASISLQGCGGGGGGGNTPPTPPPGPTPAPTPSPPGPTPPPAPPTPPSPSPKPFMPIQGISYKAMPNRDYKEGDALPAADMMQKGYQAEWGKDGRDDLGMIDDLGGSSLRTYHSIGLESKYDHGGFLDRAKDLGLHVMAGYHTQMICDGFDCFNSWYAATLKAFDAGFMPKGNTTWHPAVSMLVLQDMPDEMNFVTTSGPGLNCTEWLNQTGVKKKDQVMNRCWLTAVLSAMDGVLKAEQDRGVVNSTVKLTVAWSESPQNSIDGAVNQGIGYFGFRDVMVGAKDPNGTVGYMPRVGNATLKAAFENRWVHSMNSASPYAFIKNKVDPIYNQFLPTPWFISQLSTNTWSESQVTSNLQAISKDASAKGPFLGASVSQFQQEYQVSGVDDGLFSLGQGSAATPETDQVCEEDVRTQADRCSKGSLPVYCLKQSSRASGVASAWGGKVQGRGLCQSMDQVELFI